MVDYKDVKREDVEKQYRTKIKIWDEDARKAGKAFCHTCARIDFNNGKLASDWTAYITLNLVGTSEIRDQKDNSKVIGTTEDFKCPKDHGISIMKEFPRDEYGRPYNPDWKKSEKK